MPHTPEPLYCLHERACLPQSQQLLFWSQLAGHTAALDDAEVFTWDEALAHHRAQPSSVPLPLTYLKARCHKAVDGWLLTGAGRFHHLPSLRVYAHTCGQWPQHAPGAPSPKFWAHNGMLTEDLRSAKVFSPEEAATLPDATLWPAAYVDERAYLAVARTNVDIEEALGPERFARLSPVLLPRSAGYEAHSHA